MNLILRAVESLHAPGDGLLFVAGPFFPVFEDNLILSPGIFSAGATDCQQGQACQKNRADNEEAIRSGQKRGGDYSESKVMAAMRSLAATAGCQYQPPLSQHWE